MFEGLFQPMHLLIILAIAILVFGPKRLPELGKSLGEAIRGFRGAMHDTQAQLTSGTEEPKDPNTPPKS
ncbi:MAG TPA: twin-arginine translocase TatA/TatE family subunit [Candidatus Acidoferrales bacterium]|jgi:sec-independent protein translocase protein TatA|nr:twin-arginine translocase TatA/TatE family subunit [Candidatus Acidoferrales bacterium]